MATKKRVEYTPEKDYVYTVRPEPVKPFGTYRTPEERAAAQAASLKAANSPAAMRAKEVAEATAQAEALRAADRGTGWSAYRTPEERAAMMRAANNAGETAANSEPLNPHPLGAVDPIYQNQSNPTVRAAAQEAASNKPMVSEDIMNEILNRKPFSYNAAADALYQQYKDQYLTAGNIAMKDTMGKAAALTGGYGNTYAQTVGQQVYDDYAARAADKIPELEQLAYERWAREGDELRNNYELLHSREREAVEDERYQQEFDFRREQFDWSKLVDQHTMDLADKEFEESKNQFWANYDLKTKMYELDKFCKENQIQISWEELKQAAQAQSFDQAYKMLTYNEGRRQFDATMDFNYYKEGNNYALNDRELTMRENGTYFDRTSGSSGSTTTEKSLLSYFGNKQDNVDKAVDDAVTKLRNPRVSDNELADYLENMYGVDVGYRIYQLALQKSQQKDRTATYSNKNK